MNGSRRGFVLCAAALGGCVVVPPVPKPVPDARPAAPPGTAGAHRPAVSKPWPPPRDARRPIRVGDRWSYRLVNRYNRTIAGERTMTVLATHPVLRVAVADGAGNRLADEVYAGPWRALQDPGQDLVLIFPEPVTLLPEPPQPGTTLRFTGRYRTPDHPRPMFWSESARVESWERIRVPAGEFDALRVVRLIAFDHPDRFRERSERTDTLWYAPAVNRWVAREWTGSYAWAGERRRMHRDDWVRYELTRYRPAGR